MKFQWKDTTSVSDSQIENFASKLSVYREHLAKVVHESDNEALEASLNLVSDTEASNRVKEIADKLKNKKLKYVVVIGIGGSNLGTKAIYDALKGRGKREMFFVDTVNAFHTQKIYEMLQKCESENEFALIVISKSGKTTETVANASVLYGKLENQFENLNSQMAVISDEDSPLWKLAEENNIAKLCIPEKVGGRFSVFSPVGLLPLTLAGFDIDALLKGAREERKKCLSSEFAENTGLLAAASAYIAFEKGNTISNFFFFDPSLETVGKWWRQLMGESLGKEKDTEGNLVHTGITPIVSVGSTDLHSVGQLYLGGQIDKFTTFLSVENSGGEDLVVSGTNAFTDLVPESGGKSFSHIMEAILDGVKKAYQKRELPFVEIVLQKVDEENIGALLQMKMIEVMYLGKLMNINAFNQPNVEEYKNETRKILQNS
jgi:glucose-6-phosphate isomerase